MLVLIISSQDKHHVLTAYKSCPITGDQVFLSTATAARILSERADGSPIEARTRPPWDTDVMN
eukprot:scaffold1593_cov193-Alexandrium_tamarense.AAC.74